MEHKIRCHWVGKDPLMIQYHDTQWGVPAHQDGLLFEFLILDAFQAGLSWACVLHKRARFGEVFDGFDPKKIARYDEAKIQSLMADEGIIRNRRKIHATIANAKVFLAIQKEFGSFDQYIWGFVNHQTIVNKWTHPDQIPSQSPHAIAMSKDLKKRGMSFVGPTICYAFMQAAGMVNDHLVDCHRYHLSDGSSQ